MGRRVHPRRTSRRLRRKQRNDVPRHDSGAPGSVWFQDIVHRCLKTSFTVMCCVQEPDYRVLSCARRSPRIGRRRRLRCHLPVGPHPRPALPDRRVERNRTPLPKTPHQPHPHSPRRTGADPAPASRAASRRPRRRPAHHRFPSEHTVGFTTVGRHDLANPPPTRTHHPATQEAAPLVLPTVRNRPAQRVLAGRLHPLEAFHRSKTGDPHLLRRPLPLRPFHHRPPSGDRTHRADRFPPKRRRIRATSLHTDR